MIQNLPSRAFGRKVSGWVRTCLPIAMLLAACSAHAAGVTCRCGASASQAPCTCDGLPPGHPGEYRPYPPPTVDSADPAAPRAGDDDLMLPPGMGDAANLPEAGPSPLLAASFGTSLGALSSAPNMIGDLFGTPGGSTIIGRQFVCTGVNQGNQALFCDQDMRLFEHELGLSFSQFGIDTNGDGTIDFLPNLVEDTGGVSGASIDSPSPTNGPFFGIARTFQPDILGQGQNIETADVYQEIEIHAPAPGTGLLLGRLKIAENNSPLPKDRVFFNYSHFTNVPLFPGGVNVNRITPGFERTFANGQMSLECRFPFGTTLDNDIFVDGITNTDSLLMGNMMFIYKALLVAGPRGAVSAGVAVTAPTAADINVGLVDGTTLLVVNNQAWHFSPYLAYVGTPDDRLFFQAFLQAEFDANGNGVDAQGTGGALERIGKLNDTNYLYFDVGLGYYLYRNRFDRLISALAPVAELHWNKSLQPTDTIRSAGVQIGNFAQNVDLLNGVVGLNMTLGDATTVTVGYTAPIGAGDNKQFDGEFRLLVNHYFGTY